MNTCLESYTFINKYGIGEQIFYNQNIFWGDIVGRNDSEKLSSLLGNFFYWTEYCNLDHKNIKVSKEMYNVLTGDKVIKKWVGYGEFTYFDVCLVYTDRIIIDIDGLTLNLTIDDSVIIETESYKLEYLEYYIKLTLKNDLSERRMKSKKIIW